MPTPPKSGESQKSFMKRCVPAYKKEGESAEKAKEICNGMWYDKHPDESSSRSRSVDDVYKRLAQNQ